MVLCAGFGTRLLPLTEELPKPLVPIGDRPLLGHIADRLLGQGVEKLVANLHHRSEEFNSLINTLGDKLQVVHEPEIRGTAGGIAGARPWLGPGPVLVVNGDIVGTIPASELIEHATDGLVMAVSARPREQGTLGVDAQGRVVRMRGQVFGSEVAGADYIGVAALGARCLGELPERGCLVGDWALPELARGGEVHTVAVCSDWSDIGSLESYFAANMRWRKEHRGEGSWVAPGARVGPSVRLVESLVGEGASVAGQGVVERCVVWPRAQVEAPLADAIVTTTGRVVTLPPR